MQSTINYDVQKIKVDSKAEVLETENLKPSATAIDKSIEFSSPKTSGFVNVKHEGPFPDDNIAEDREEDTVNCLLWSYI